MSEPAGWYGNPDGTETQRYWDGGNWTHDVRPVPGPAGFDPSQTTASGPGPAPLAGGAPLAGAAAPAVPQTEPSGSISDLVGVLFDFGMNRSISPALARTGYRLGAIVILVVAALFLVGGLQGGGIGAIVALLVFPLLALLWLLGLRLLCESAIDRSAGGGTEAA